MRLEHALKCWRPLGERYFLHTDGTISVIAEIAGYDIYMAAEEAAGAYLNGLRSLIDTAPFEVSLEFHIRRRRDKRNAAMFGNQPLKRESVVLSSLRKTYMKHLADYFYLNRIFVVIQWHRNGTLGRNLLNLFVADGPDRALKEAIQNCTKLEEYCQKGLRGFSDLRFLNTEEGIRFLYESSHYHPCKKLPESGYMLRDILTPTGEKRGGLYRMNSVMIKPFLMYFYPEPNVRLLTDLVACLPVELDIAFYLRRCDHAHFLRKSGGDEIRQERQIAQADVEAEKRLEDISAWRRYVVENGLQIFTNAFYCKLYGSEEEIEEQAASLSEQLAVLGAVLESEHLTEHAIIYSLPTNIMYAGKFMRQDHTEMIMSLLPAVCFGQGTGHQEAFVGTNFTFVGFDYTNKSGGEFYHSLTIAKTGSGKGVMNCARILQLFGLGYDFYTIEIGNTYEFLFKMLGGDYVAIDPDTSVINPFPLCGRCRYKDVFGIGIADGAFSGPNSHRRQTGNERA